MKDMMELKYWYILLLIHNNVDSLNKSLYPPHSPSKPWELFSANSNNARYERENWRSKKKDIKNQPKIKVHKI